MRIPLSNTAWLVRYASVALLLVACAPVVAPSPTPAPEPGLLLTGADDTARLRELLARVLEPRSAYYDPALTQPPALRVGALPPDWPVAVPLPEGADLIGSLDEPAPLLGAQVFLNVNQPPHAVMAFYTDAFVGQGYSLWEPGGPPVFTGYNRFASFCASDGRGQLGVGARQNASGVTEVLLTLVTDERTVSCDSGLPNEQYERTQHVLPTLEAPPGVELRGSGSGYGLEGQADFHTELLTSLTPAALAAHYAPSLEAQGWARVAESGTGPVAWSEWTRVDGEGFRWNAVLIITAGPAGSDRRRAEFRMEMELEK